MRNLKSIGLLLGTAAFLAATLSVAAEPIQLCSFKAAKKTAEENGVPILLRIGGKWCTTCSKFDEAAENDEKVQSALAKQVVLCVVDMKTDEGAELARLYSVPKSSYAYPTFVLANGRGELMDRWMGYYDAENFLEHLTAALEDPITVRERMARFEEHPTEIDARKLGELRDYEGFYAESAAYYRRAHALNPESETVYEMYLLNTMAKGIEGHLFTADEVRQQADLALNSPKVKVKQLGKLAGIMGKVAKQTGDMADYTPYLKIAIERTAGVEGDEDIQKMRTWLLPDYALYVEKDEKKATEYKKQEFAAAAAPKDWMKNANMLNNFAWWCFENQINLNEAEKFARKGVEMAKPGNQKANILDTVAEICNLKGDCGDAVTLIRLAVAEDPENEYFQKQLERFERLLAAKSD